MAELEFPSCGRYASSFRSTESQIASPDLVMLIAAPLSEYYSRAGSQRVPQD